MKTTPKKMDPTAAFPVAERLPPNEAELKTALGRAFAPVATVIAHLQNTYPDVRCEWHYSPQSGWYQIHLRRERRLVYVVPRRRNFRVAIILGDKAIAAVLAGLQAERMHVALETATRYSEGTAFYFDREAFKPELVAAMLDAKIGH
jgi:hypothetical protein